MVSIVPINVDETTIICLVLDDLFLSDLEALAILEITLSHGEDLRSLLSSDW
jgi:hypothetical protein